MWMYDWNWLNILKYWHVTIVQTGKKILKNFKIWPNFNKLLGVLCTVDILFMMIILEVWL